jgi:L-ascorbate metabolism protein UlaG (beta-lactamase superfamily)
VYWGWSNTCEFEGRRFWEYVSTNPNYYAKVEYYRSSRQVGGPAVWCETSLGHMQNLYLMPGYQKKGVGFMHGRVANILSVVILVVLLLTSSVLLYAARSNRQVDVMQTSVGDLRLMPIFHGSVMLEFGGKVIHVDPWSQGDFTDIPQADLIVVTHTHADHLDRVMIDKLKKPATIIVGPPAVIDTLNCAPACGQVETISDTEKQTVMGIEIEGVPMYNLVRGSTPGMPFHHKGVGSGYILSFGDTRVYFSGDTECTPEMKALKKITVAFLAMNPPRTETPVEAAECTKAFKPKFAYPYHYRGSKTDEFADALKGSGIEVRVRKLEGEP